MPFSLYGARLGHRRSPHQLDLSDQLLCHHQREPEGRVPPAWLVAQDAPKSLTAGTIKGPEIIQGVTIEDYQIERVVAGQFMQHELEHLTVASIDRGKLGGEHLDTVSKVGKIVGHVGLLLEGC